MVCLLAHEPLHQTRALSSIYHLHLIIEIEGTVAESFPDVWGKPERQLSEGLDSFCFYPHVGVKDSILYLAFLHICSHVYRGWG